MINSMIGSMTQNKRDIQFQQKIKSNIKCKDWSTIKRAISKENVRWGKIMSE